MDVEYQYSQGKKDEVVWNLISFFNNPFCRDFFIYGGEAAKLGEFPFVALLGYKDLQESSPNGVVYLCGGTLINRLVVIWFLDFLNLDNILSSQVW